MTDSASNCNYKNFWSEFPADDFVSCDKYYVQATSCVGFYAWKLIDMTNLAMTQTLLSLFEIIVHIERQTNLILHHEASRLGRNHDSVKSKTLEKQIFIGFR